MIEYQLKQTGEEIQEILDSVPKKVDKVFGKGLSTNDFTNEDKEKLDKAPTTDYVDKKVADIPTPDVSGQIATHNTSESAHSDIRELIVSYLKSAKGYTDEAIHNLVNGAPEVLDTLAEIATAIQGNKSAVDAINEAIATKLSKTDAEKLYADKNHTHKEYLTEHQSLEDYAKKTDIPDISGKVDKIEGKGLSTNDYTTDEKNKLKDLSNYNDKDIKDALVKRATYADLTEFNVSIKCPTWGVKSDGSAGGNLYTQETAIAAFKKFITDNAQLGILVTAGKKIVYIGIDNNVYTLEYNGTDWIDRLASKAEKNHTHSKSDIGLGNVDNTSDKNKPVSIEQQKVLDLKMSKEDYVDDDFFIKSSLINPLYGKAKGVKSINNSTYRKTISELKEFTYNSYIYLTPEYKSSNTGILRNSSNTNNYIDLQWGLRTIRIWFNNFTECIEIENKLIKRNVFLLSVTYSPKNIKVYYDDILVKNIDTEDIIYSPMIKSASADTGGRNAINYNMRFFNYALSADEIKVLYNNGRSDKYILPNSYKKIDVATQQGCIGEYLPSSLTKTQWRDTSGQGNHLIATGTPELIYESPYQETLTGSGAPSVIPDFVGQEYYDTTNKINYTAFGTENMEDWL